MEIKQTKTYAIDFDNTLCKTDDMDYINSFPLQNRIDGVNKLFAENNLIVILTGRNWSWLGLTKKQLSDWGINYHQLIMGNFPADIYINDKNETIKFLEEI